MPTNQKDSDPSQPIRAWPHPVCASVMIGVLLGYLS